MKEKILGIIPARAGSKGIPGKNIRKLAGKPLLAYTIEIANNVSIFERVILSTDSKDIADVGKNFGVEVPFIRPDDLSKDETPMLPVLQHAVSSLYSKDLFPDYICILQPSSPFREAEDLVKGYNLLLNSGCDSVVSVEQIPDHYSPDLVMKIKNGKLSHFLDDETKVSRRQDARKAYTRSGCFYFTRTSLLMEENTIYGKDCRAVIINNKNAVNLDTMADWKLGQEVAKKLMNGE